MAGPLTIQRVPRGLLFALAMKGSGDLPTELGPQVAAIFDVTKFYLLENIRSITSAIPAVGPDNYYTPGALAVPAGEIWLPINFTIQRLNGVGVGTLFSVQLGYARKITNGVQVFPSSQVIPDNGDVLLSYQFDGDFILTPGDSLGAVTYNGTYASNPTITCTLDYYRLEI